MIELRLFGSLQLRGAAGDSSLASQPKRLALLSYLALTGERGAARRDKIIALLWPELDEAHGRNALSQSLHVIRRSLGADALTPEGDDAIRLNADVVWSDVAEFDRAVRDGRHLAALDLYRGDLLDGFFIARAPDFERWLEMERDGRRRRAVIAAFAAADEAASDSRTVPASAWATRAVEISGFNESDARRAMQLLERIGDPGAALAIYDRLRARLDADHELAPAPDTVAVANRLRASMSGERAAAMHGNGSSDVTMRAPTRQFPSRLPFVGFAGIAIVAILFSARHRDERPTVIRLPMDASAAPPAAGIAGNTLALSPDGMQLVYVAAGPAGTHLVARRLDDGGVTPIPGTSNARHPFFSPDGKWIGFEQNGALRRSRLNGDALLTICAGREQIRGATWTSVTEIVFATAEGLWRVPASGGRPVQIVGKQTLTGVARWPEALPDGRAVLLTITTNTGSWLAAQPLPRGPLKQLGVEGSNVHFVPPDHLVFARADGTLMSVAFDAKRLEVRGAPTLVVDDVFVGNAGAGKFAASRAGAMVYMREPREHGLVLVDALGRRDKIDLADRRFGAPRISPDGGRIAVSVASAGSTSDIWVVDVRRRTLDRVTVDSGSLNPIWSPDGSRIILSTMTPSVTPGFMLREISLGNMEPGRTLLDPAQGQIPQAVTRDGSLVFSRRDLRTAWDLWVVPLARTAKPVPLVVAERDQFAATVSSDGRLLAYVSNEFGTDRVYVRTLGESGAGSTISAGDGREPRWSPSGRALYFRASGAMHVMDFPNEVSAVPWRPRRLFGDQDFVTAAYGAAFDVHPDGRLLMLEKSKSDVELMVLLHWFGK